MTMPKNILLAIIALFFVTGGRSAPAPKREYVITVQELRDALGKSHLSPASQRVRKLLGEKPTASYFVGGPGELDETSFYHLFYTSGVELRYDEDSKLTTIFLYVEPSENYKKYKGELPHGFKSGEKPADVKKKLGDPAEMNDGAAAVPESKQSQLGAWWTYPTKGLLVRFSTVKADDARAVVEAIVITIPEK